MNERKRQRNNFLISQTIKNLPVVICQIGLCFIAYLDINCPCFLPSNLAEYDLLKSSLKWSALSFKRIASTLKWSQSSLNGVHQV